MTETLTLAIIGHLVGDYLLQNDWMASGKKRSSIICLIHCCIWTGAVMWFAGWSGNAAALVLLTTHFIQDRTNIIKFWMTDINRQPKFYEPPMAPWSIIVVDNVWHIVAIWFVWKFLI